MTAGAFETERLLCRPFRRSDAEDMLRNWAADPDIQTEYGEPVYTDIAQVNELLDQYISPAGEKSRYRWAIIEKASGENMGGLSDGRGRILYRKTLLGQRLCR